MNRLAAFYLTLAASIWGIMYVSSKYVMEYVPPLTLVFIRFLIAFLMFSVIVLFSKTSLKASKRDTLWFFLIGLIGYSISITTQFIGTELTSAHMGSLITAFSPTCIMLFAFLLLKEKIYFHQVISLLIATLGIGIISWDQTSLSIDHQNMLGIGILMIAAITWGLYSVLSKGVSNRYSPLVIQWYCSLVGSITMFPFIFTETIDWKVLLNGPEIWGNVLFLGIISTAGAFYLWNKGFQLIEAGKASLFFFLQPVVGTLLGWAILDETITLPFVIGGICIFIGLILNQGQKKSFAPLQQSKLFKRSF